jgi:hypothetical protein
MSTSRIPIEDPSASPQLYDQIIGNQNKFMLLFAADLQESVGQPSHPASARSAPNTGG